MAIHYAKGVNVQTGTVEFNGTKVAKVIFSQEFKSHPAINITLEDSGAAQVPYRTKVSKANFRVVFKNPFTGTVGWIAMEN